MFTYKPSIPTLTLPFTHTHLHTRQQPSKEAGSCNLAQNLVAITQSESPLTRTVPDDKSRGGDSAPLVQSPFARAPLSFLRRTSTSPHKRRHLLTSHPVHQGDAPRSAVLEQSRRRHSVMFSQASFRPLSDLPPQRPVSAYSTNSHPSPSSALQTPENTSGRNSPLAEEDAFDLDDPHFNAKSRSRTSSIRSIGRPDRPKEHRSSTAGGVATFVKPEDIGGLLKSLSRSEERHHHFSEVSRLGQASFYLIFPLLFIRSAFSKNPYVATPVNK